MATIEERAAAYTRGKDMFNNAFYFGYIAGAKEQKHIDIEEAYKWWSSRADELGFSKYQIELFKQHMEDQS